MRVVIALILLTGFLSGCAASPEARAAQSERRAQRTAAALANRTDADSLAVAGLSSLRKHPDQALSLLAHASDADPQRADLIWLQAEVCHKVEACDPEAYETRLRALDPSNGAGWLAALERANTAQDKPAMDAALHAISHSDRVNIYWTTLIAHLSRAAVQPKMMSLQEAETRVIGYLSAEAIPALQTISHACKGERLQQPEYAEACRGIAKSFEQGDTYIIEMIGVTIARRVWPEDSVEWRAADEARRLHEYRIQQWQKVNPPIWATPQWAERFLALCEQHRREQDVFLAQFVDAGANPNPPEQ